MVVVGSDLNSVAGCVARVMGTFVIVAFLRHVALPCMLVLQGVCFQVDFLLARVHARTREIKLHGFNGTRNLRVLQSVLLHVTLFCVCMKEQVRHDGAERWPHRKAQSAYIYRVMPRSRR